MLVKRSYLYLVANCLEVIVAQQLAPLNLAALYGSGLSPGAEIFYPSAPGYSDHVTQRWNLYDAPTYFGAIKPATEADVQHIVKVSARNNVTFLATGRGHGSTSTLKAVNGIEIDLSSFRTIEVDAQNSKLLPADLSTSPSSSTLYMMHIRCCVRHSFPMLCSVNGLWLC